MPDDDDFDDALHGRPLKPGTEPARHLSREEMQNMRTELRNSILRTFRQFLDYLKDPSSVPPDMEARFDTYKRREKRLGFIDIEAEHFDQQMMHVFAHAAEVGDMEPAKIEKYLDYVSQRLTKEIDIYETNNLTYVAGIPIGDGYIFPMQDETFEQHNVFNAVMSVFHNTRGFGAAFGIEGDYQAYTYTKPDAAYDQAVTLGYEFEDDKGLCDYVNAMMPVGISFQPPSVRGAGDNN